MPYASDAQRKFMHARHPEIAKRWGKEIHKGALKRYKDKNNGRVQGK